MICGSRKPNTIWAACQFPHDHGAGQQQPDVGNRLQRLVRKGWIACTEDAVARHAQLALHRGLDVDSAQDAESFRLEYLGGLVQRRDVGAARNLHRSPQTL